MPHPGEHDADRAGARHGGQAGQQHVGRRTVLAGDGLAVECEVHRRRQDQMRIVRREPDARRCRLAFAGQPRGQRDALVEPADQSVDEARGHVLDDQHRQREVGRQLGEDGMQRARSPRRRADAHHGRTGRVQDRGERRRRGRRVVSVDPCTTQAAEAVAQRHRRRAGRVVESQVRLGLRLQRAGGERLGRPLGTAPGVCAEDEDGNRVRAHDLLDRADAAHARQLDVHRDQVGCEAGNRLERLLAGGADADHLEVLTALEEPCEGEGVRRRVLADEHAGGCDLAGHRARRRATVSSRARWSNSSLTM